MQVPGPGEKPGCSDAMKRGMEGPPAPRPGVVGGLTELREISLGEFPSQSIAIHSSLSHCLFIQLTPGDFLQLGHLDDSSLYREDPRLTAGDWATQGRADPTPKAALFPPHDLPACRPQFQLGP